MTMSSINGSFQYRPLDSGAGEIRLLSQRFGPAALGATEGVLQCMVSHVPILHCPAYKALSYTWGESSACKISMHVDGHSFEVSQNVEDALRAIWHSNPSAYVWIDAVSINQDDIPERNAQVSRMTDIYQTAENVVVWLGRSTRETTVVMQFLRENGEAVLRKDPSLRSQDTRARIWWPLVRELLSRPWWKRLWILQEVAVAQSVEILCGSDSIPWDLIGTKIVAEDHKEVPIQGDMYSDMNRAIEVRNIRFLHQRIRSQGKLAIDWKELVMRSRAAEATLPVDRLYGLLGLAQLQLPGLQVDYAAPVEDVLKQFTRLLIQRDRRLDFICMGGHRTSPVALPSWVPNLGASFRTNPFNKMRVLSRFRVKFDANGTAGDDGILGTDPNVCFDFSKDGNALSVEGLLVDKISGLADVIPDVDETFGEMQTRYVERALSLFPEVLCDPDSRYAPGTSKIEALQITLTADTGPDKMRRTTGRVLTETAETPHANPIARDLLRGSRRTLIDQLIASSDPVITSWANRNRKFVVSSQGYMGLVPEHTQPNDVICVIFGCDVPVILRRTADHYIFVGESYVHGLMFGFAIDEWKRGSFQRETFALR